MSQEEFYELDYQVMGLVFDVHNDLGPLCDERIYQDELARRCRRAGIEDVLTEVPILVSHKDFSKKYYMDMLARGGGVYELKTVRSLAPEHKSQALHYLLLTGLTHGKLLNMRTPAVQHHFISTSLTPQDRHSYRIDDREWQGTDNGSKEFRLLLADLLSDWGAFLDIGLFYEAVVHFRGGEDSVVKRIDVVSNSRVIGTQRAHLLTPSTAFRISAVHRSPQSFEEHLRRLLSHTRLRAIQWVNLNRHTITFKTLLR